MRAHFAALDAEGVAQLTYANHEAVPETMRVGDYFRAVSLFKARAACISKHTLGRTMGRMGRNQATTRIPVSPLRC